MSAPAQARIYGEAGADILAGGEGDDALTGGASADQLSGGNGVDLALYDSATAAVTVNLATGTGTAGDAAGDSYSSIENAMGLPMATPSPAMPAPTRCGAWRATTRWSGVAGPMG